MGWAKYDEDDRDAIEERWVNQGDFNPSVFNYTSNCATVRSNERHHSRKTKAYAKALAAYYTAHYSIQEEE